MIGTVVASAIGAKSLAGLIAALVILGGLLAGRLPLALAQHAGGDVGRRARNEAGNDAHRARGIILGMGAGQGKLRGKRQEQRQARRKRSSPSAVHVVSSRWSERTACR